MMGLLEEENERKADDSPEPESTVRIQRTKLNRRMINFQKACACTTILVIIYFLYYNSLQQNQIKNSAINSFQNTRKLDTSCCEKKYECQMECLGKEIAFTPLNKLVIPGTHNSGVYTAAFQSRTRASHNLSEIVRDELRKRVERFLRQGIISQEMLIELLSNQAICQELSVSEQLRAGVRYLDMRVCEDYRGHLFLCHRVYAADFLAVLEEIRDFLEINTKEILIIDIHGVIQSSGEKSTIGDALMRKFGSLLIVDKLNEIVSTLWINNKRVVILYDEDPRFQSRSAIYRPWPRCHIGLSGAVAMISFNEKQMCDNNNITPRMLSVNDLECSPTIWDILKGYFIPALYPSSLLENNKVFVYPELISTMEGKQSDINSSCFNIIMVDFIQEGVINWAIRKNGEAGRAEG